MATLTVQEITSVGLEASYDSASGGGDDFPNTGREFIHIKNDSGGDITLTVETTITVESLAVTDRTVVITAGEERFVGPFLPKYYNDGNSVNLSYSGVTSLTLAILKLA